MRARIILPALLLILALAGVWVWRGLAPSVAIATASIGPAVQAVYATGNVEPVHWARVGPAVRARITAVLVEEGARQSREDAANYSPFVIRGAFIATFMNKYSALPMALTGTLSHDTAARRVKDTASFFITSTLPGALERFGPGFKSAAMVAALGSSLG